MADQQDLPPPNLPNALDGIPKLVDKDTVMRIIDLQMTAIDRLESTNKGLVNCTTMAQNKLASTTKLFKKSSKQISESRKDLDMIYKKILELKSKIEAEK